MTFNSDPHSSRYQWILHCPTLESFTWKASPIEVRTLIHHPIQKDCGPPLDNLRIPDVPQDDGWASALEKIGNCLGNFTHLDLDGTFGPQAFKALGPHFSIAVDLRLYGFSSAVWDVLCFCPMLEILHASSVFAKDIAEGGPWVCQKLETVMMCFRVTESEQDLQPVVFERLSALVRHRHLDMSYLDETSRDGVLEFRLECGLGKLENLKELRVVEFSYEHNTNLMQRLGRDDIEWMMDNWGREIEAQLNIDEARLVRSDP